MNPRSTQGKQTDEAVALAQLQQRIEQMGPVQYERWILSYPAFPGLSLDETRRQLRQMTRRWCRFTVEALRTDRLNLEAQQRLWRARALEIAKRDAE